MVLSGPVKGHLSWEGSPSHCRDGGQDNFKYQAFLLTILDTNKLNRYAYFISAAIKRSYSYKLCGHGKRTKTKFMQRETEDLTRSAFHKKPCLGRRTGELQYLYIQVYSRSVVRGSRCAQWLRIRKDTPQTQITVKWLKGSTCLNCNQSDITHSLKLVMHNYKYMCRIGSVWIQWMVNINQFKHTFTWRGDAWSKQNQ